MSAPAIPRADFGGAPSMQRTAMPFGAVEPPSDSIVLHVKVLSPDANERLEVARTLRQALAEQRVGSKGLAVLITDADVVVELSSLSPIAAKLAADVMQRLGIAQ